MQSVANIISKPITSCLEESPRARYNLGGPGAVNYNDQFPFQCVLMWNGQKAG